MSILKVANIHFEAAGTKRIDYLNDDVLRISFGETVLSGNARFNGNGATKLSVGTTAQRPTGESGLIRFNTQVGSFEGHNGTAWANIVSGIIDLTPANNYSSEVGAAANGWANTISATRTNAANGWANTVASASADAANTLSLTRASAANGWANTISLERTSAANGWANTVSPVGGKQTIWIPAAAMTPRTTNGAGIGTSETVTNDVMIKTLDFDTTTQEFAQFAIQMPKSWNEGTLISQFVWSHATTTTNFGVAWQIQAVGFANDDALDTAFGSAVTVTDTGGTANDIYITSETSAMTVGGTPAAEEYVVFQVARAPANGSDTMAIDARLHGLKIHYTIDAAKDD